MLTLAECRRILGPDSRIDDDQLATLRFQLYGLADIVLSMDTYAAQGVLQKTGREKQSKEGE